MRTLDEDTKPKDCFVAFVQYVEAPLADEVVAISKSDLLSVLSERSIYLEDETQKTISGNAMLLEKFHEQWKQYKTRILSVLAVLLAETTIVSIIRLVELVSK